MAKASTSPGPAKAEMGHNQAPDYAKIVSDELTRDYAEMIKTLTGYLEEARKLPRKIDSDEAMQPFADLIKKIRDLKKRLESHREAEKEPYFRKGQAVDQFFFGLSGKLGRRNKTDNAGAEDILNAICEDWLDRKQQAEAAKRREEQRKAEEAARIERERIAEQQRIADEAARKERQRIAELEAEQAEIAAKAARARNAENQERLQREAAEAQAKIDKERAEQIERDRIAQDKIKEDRIAAEALEQKADDARIDATAKPGDMVRTRLEGGAMATMAQVPHVEISDVSKLNKELLWPFLKDEHVLMALKAWAKTKSHKTQMDGAIIKMVNKGQIR